jgi:predicted MPP superfamily phosphohydrolase
MDAFPYRLLQPDELAGFLIFVTIVALVFVLAGGALIRSLRRTSKTPLQRSVDRITMALAMAGVVCIGYGYFLEPYRLSVTHVEIATAKMAPNAAPIRIVHLSDLHSDPKARLEPRLAAAVAAEHPDIVVFTGDSINSPEGLPVFQQALASLAKIAPTFVVEGNWDINYWPGVKRFDGTGAEELNGTAKRLEIHGTPVWVAGLAVGNERELEPVMRRIPADELSVLLYHYPDLMPEASAQHVDLYCAGHTHGGQIALPIYGALITLSRFGKRYESGLFHEGQTWMYVNRGIGMEGGLVPRVRFWATPEITSIEIHAKTYP